MTDYNSLTDTLEAVWTRLTDAPTNPASPARFLALATVGRSGGAEARMIVLRAADRDQAQLTAFTNAASAKVAELSAMPSATLLVWDPAELLQIRLRSTVTQRPATDADWTRLPPRDHALYARDPLPGTPLDTPTANTPTPDAALFTILTARIDEIETLHLGRDLHRRALFRRTDAFRGQWIAP